jgi:hypothetical protein
MRNLLLSAVLVVVVVVVAAAGAVASPARRDGLDGVRTWAFAIGDGDLMGNVSKRFAPYELVVVDGESARFFGSPTSKRKFARSGRAMPNRPGKADAQPRSRVGLRL